MGYIIYNNKLDSTVTTVATVSSGSITDDTSINKLTTRALADKYEYSKTGLGTLTLTMTLGSTITENALSVMGRNNTGLTLQSITLYNGASDQGLTTPDPITKSRFVDDVYISDEHYIFDGYYTFDKIVILYSDVDGSDGFFQKILCGKAYDINFSPSGLNYSPADTSKKDYSNGRQAYVNTGITYNNLKAISTPITHQQAWNSGGVSVNDINLNSRTDQPLILIPSDSSNISVYGTQKNLATLTPVAKKDGSDWYWKATFNIEEEL